MTQIENAQIVINARDLGFRLSRRLGNMVSARGSELVTNVLYFRGLKVWIHGMPFGRDTQVVTGRDHDCCPPRFEKLRLRLRSEATIPGSNALSAGTYKMSTPYDVMWSIEKSQEDDWLVTLNASGVGESAFKSWRVARDLIDRGVDMGQYRVIVDTGQCRPVGVLPDPAVFKARKLSGLVILEE